MTRRNLVVSCMLWGTGLFLWGFAIGSVVLSNRTLGHLSLILCPLIFMIAILRYRDKWEELFKSLK